VENNGLLYYEMWLLATLNIDMGTAFKGRAFGISPEMMSQDASLNKDVDDGALRLIILTNHLPDADSRKFSMA
jgi:hypothetical protein